jgi:hypothetical protein
VAKLIGETNMTRGGRNTQEKIRDACARRLGAVDVEISRAREKVSTMSEQWYSLKVKLPGDRGWRFVGRRRLMSELLALVESSDTIPLTINQARDPSLS